VPVVIPGPTVTVNPARRVRGRVRPPGDKSISHRYALLAGLADGTSVIHGFAPGADCAATLECLARLGIRIDRRPASDGALAVSLHRSAARLCAPGRPLDAANSGTTMRLLAGIVAGHPGLEVELRGDASLSRRPMRRVIDPLTRMGATIASEGGRPPLRIRGAALTAIEFVPEVPSAQVKSAVLLAGLFARGTTRIDEPVATRDHTERAFGEFGIRLDREGASLAVEGGQRFGGRELDVPGDISSGAFWACAAAARPGSDVVLERVGLNPTRTAVLDLLRRWGADISIEAIDSPGGEPRGTVRIRGEAQGDLTLTAEDVPGVIDELPGLAAMAAGGGRLRVSGAGELRVKESDRISALVAGLRALGARAEESRDGFSIEGGRLTGGTADAAGDHRLAMAFAIAALSADAPSTIVGADAVRISYPGFFETLASLTRESR
jgi:3-phosphoshikimate 1-carboxyvinyltransferase